MSKGAKNPKYTPTTETPLVTTGYQGMGYTQTPQTWNQASKPAWMQGAWDMPTWGQAASQDGSGQVANQQIPLPQAATAAPPRAPGKAEMLMAMQQQPQGQQYTPFNQG